MKTSLLPHSVTYYHRVKHGEEYLFEKTHLSPVRLRTAQAPSQEGEETSVAGVLYVFPSETISPIPDFSTSGDFFVRGEAEDSAPPKDGSAFRVIRVEAFDAIGKINFIKLDGVANRGDGV